MATQQLTPLRQRMLDDMKLRNMAKGTRRSYVHSVADFSAFHGRSPDELTLEDVRDYQLHLVARGLKAASICPIMSALRFLYAVTLDRPEQAARIPLPRKADPLPAILSPDEVARLLAAVSDSLFECGSGCGSHLTVASPKGAHDRRGWERRTGCGRRRTGRGTSRA